MRGFAMLLATAGILALFGEASITNRSSRIPSRCDRCAINDVMERFASEQNRKTETPEGMSTPVTANPVVQSTDASSSPPPPPSPSPQTPEHANEKEDEEKEDAQMLASGLLIQEYTGRPSYSRFVRQRPNCDSSPSQPAEDSRGRDRLQRVAPTAFTHGGYRSKWGGDMRFSVSKR
jgi:hypothetical protein